MSGGRPSGTVTFLFTDIEGSTGLWEEHPREMEVALSLHDSIVRDTIEGHAGYIFATGGDGFAAAFADPVDAVDAATEIQQDIREAEFPGEVELAVRVGIHSGTADERGGDYYGQAPTRTARIMGAASGGQTLLSAAVAALLPSSVSVEDLGVHRLRDLSEPIGVLQLKLGGDESFREIRTLARSSERLPLLLTPLIGREDLVDEIAGLVLANRLVTLSGVGGVGKTRLSLEVAGEISDSVEGGCWFVELAPAHDSVEAITAVISALGIAVPGQMTAIEAVSEHFGRTEVVLILDNCEHLVDDARDMAQDLLGLCPGLSVLATSREGLGLPGEVIRMVPSLSSAPEAQSTAPAVRLFVDRAVALGSWAPNEDDLPVITEICDRLDGIPLAVELAAGRATVLSPGEMLARLEDRFRLLTGRASARLERHQTLHAAVQWSYDLLELDERNTLNRIGVFVGSFDAAAVAAVTDEDLDAVLDTLESLINRSLVQVEAGDGPRRFKLLETIRQFSKDRLQEAGELESTRLAHAAHLADESVRLGERLRGPDEPAAFAEILQQAPDRRAAVAFSLAERDSRLVAKLIGPMSATPAITAGVVTSLASMETLELAALDPNWGARLVALAGMDLYLRADVNSIPILDEFFQHAVEVDDELAVAEAYRAWSSINALQGDSEAALLHAERSVEYAQRVGDDWELSMCLAVLAAWSMAFGEPRLPSVEHALDLARGTENPTVIGAAAGILAYTVELTDPDRALAVAGEVQVIPDGAVRAGADVANSVAARVLFRRGDTAESVVILSEILPSLLASGLRTEYSYCAALLAGCLAALGDADRAALLAGRFAGSTSWAQQEEVERRITEMLDEAIGSARRTELGEQSRQIPFTDATVLVAESLEHAAELLGARVDD